MKRSNDVSLNLKRDTTVLFTSPEAEIHMAIRTVEYESILRRVRKLGDPLPNALLWSTTAAGGALGTTVATIILMGTKATLHSWIIPVLWVIVGFAGLFALALWKIHSRLTERGGDDVTDLCEDMERMKSYFPTIQLPPVAHRGAQSPESA